MDENTEPSNNLEIDSLEVDPLSDEDLENVAGGLAEGCSGCGSYSQCSNPPPPPPPGDEVA